MANAQISLGSKLGLLNNAATGESYYDQFRPFLRGIDALVQANVLSASISTPPTTPSDGDAYILSSGGTGDWENYTNDLAVWAAQSTDLGGNTLAPAWDFYIPKAGWLIWVEDTSSYMRFNGTSWTAFSGGDNFVDEEVPNGIIDGENLVFTLSKVPNPTTSLKLYTGGMRMIRGEDFDYTLEGNTITYSIAPTGHHVCDYRYSGNSNEEAVIKGIISVTSTSGGDFTIAHGLSAAPTAAFIMPTSDGIIWFQSPTMFDATNLYLTASDVDITCNIVLL